ncbi:DUF262 domain-containing protein [Chryseobacterium vrystaatense]|uniref:GmrSD restriction endonucleases N-terminal domain-containing protein n=1 Tax=Chryseobacterium vrystaatense TaxID=307480 RepID=A0A1M5I9D4_9FLAO|nr:DUF262 domain-containing protein [Chryseobacterium vrystaatense]SHG24835.1 Protein of unknown function DUF262 [Chryseobacterium vrystaatense]
MKTYNLKDFLTGPLTSVIDNEEDYCYEVVNYNSRTDSSDESVNILSALKIPLIQRDYAQGREANTDLREGFITRLLQHLESGEELKLDFIYGSVDRKNGTVFLPLDGQQRLTTLFLLHWYIVKTECASDSEYEEMFTKFSYETRDTSRRFFEKLSGFSLKRNPAEDIKNAYWFSDQYRLDPTIDAVLNTLETIHTFYNRLAVKGSLYLNLDKIVFYVLPMDQFKLTDDLYIKLNARGKLLSSFENLKADLIGWIKSCGHFDGEVQNEHGIVLPHFDCIAEKFDNRWSRFFWKKAKTNSISKKTVDPYFFRFIHRVLINDYIVAYKGAAGDLLKDPTYTSLLFREKEMYFANFDFYRALISKEFVLKMEKLLDFYANYGFEIFDHVQPLWDTEYQWDIFKGDQDNRFTMDDRMLFDAVNVYAEKNGVLDLSKFKEWIRVVWNLIADPDIRSIGANKTAIQFIRTIAEYSSDILKDLAGGQLDELMNDNKNIHSIQLKEEKQKAVLLSEAGAQWQNIIFEAESFGILQGNISVLLQDVYVPEVLCDKFEKFKYLFSANGPNQIIENERYTMMRYILACFTDWSKLEESFNFSSTVLNWKTYLRRNNDVMEAVRGLLLLDESSIQDHILKTINGQSQLDTEDEKLKIAHAHLYQDNQFHIWMQNDGVNKVKWLWKHFFAIRPSAWYSKVMIDNYRNELIEELIYIFGINILNNHRCDVSAYFWGENLEISKETESCNISFYFDSEKMLYIGLKKELNPNLTVDAEEDDIWIKKFSYEYSDIHELSDISPFIENIKTDLAEKKCSFLRALETEDAVMD